MSHITDRNFIIGIFLNVRDKENKIKCSQLSQQFGNMSLPLDNTIESENRYLKHIYSRKIAEYIAGHYFGPETKNVMNILIEFYYETYGKDSLNNILHDLYKDYMYVFHNKFVNKDKIDNAITTILSYKPSIEYSIFSYSCYVAYYDLIMVKRSDAIEYVRSVSEYLLPDIANVVFDHAYNFDPNEHYDLAISL